MHPELEFFLEDALAPVERTSPEIGRVVVEPDYEVTPDAKDAGHVASELVQCLRETGVDNNAIAAHEGQVIEPSGAYRLLGKYIRRITLHRDTVQGAWIEVAPPGNWI
jgi:hypothetical protein